MGGQALAADDVVCCTKCRPATSGTKTKLEKGRFFHFVAVAPAPLVTNNNDIRVPALVNATLGCSKRRQHMLILTQSVLVFFLLLHT